MAVRNLLYAVFFAVFSLSEVSHSQELWEYCGNEPADVAFLLDSSNSIWGPDFRRQIDFVEDVVSMFQIGKNATRVGLVTYNDHVYLQFSLRRYYKKARLLSAIRNVRETSGYSTATDLALKYSRTYLFKARGGGRPGVAKVIVVITDGRSRNMLRTLIEASRAKRNHVHLFAIGVGRAVNSAELSRMASQPSKEYFFHVAGYSALDSLKKILAIKTCQVTHPPTKPTTVRTTITTTTTTTTTPTTTTTTTTTPPPTTTTTTPTTTTTETTTTPTTTTTTPLPTTTTTTPTTTTTIPTTTTTPMSTTTTWVDIVRKACNGKMVDIVFALDNSDAVTHDDFWQMIRFVRDFARGLDIRHNGTRIGLVLFSEFVQQGIDLDEHDDIHGLVSHLYKMQMSKGMAKMDEMLRYVRTKSFRRSVIRKGAAQVVIMLTASSSRKIHKAKKQALRARTSGLTIIAIGVGDKVKAEELRLITGMDKSAKAQTDSKKKVLTPPPTHTVLDSEAAMMMEDLMMGDDPSAISHVMLDGAEEDMAKNILHEKKKKNTKVENGDVDIDLFGSNDNETNLMNEKGKEIDLFEGDENTPIGADSEEAPTPISLMGDEISSINPGEVGVKTSDETAEEAIDKLSKMAVQNIPKGLVDENGDDMMKELMGKEDNDDMMRELVENTNEDLLTKRISMGDNEMMKELMEDDDDEDDDDDDELEEDDEDEDMSELLDGDVDGEGVGVSVDGILEPLITTTTPPPSVSPVFTLDNFTQLEEILLDTVLLTCSAEASYNPVSDQPCGTRQEADMMFVVDSANAGRKNTKKAMEFMKSIAGQMEIDRDNIQLGLVAPDPCAPQEQRQSFNLSQHQDKENLIDSLKTDTSDFSGLVKDLRKTAFKHRNGARKGAKRVAVLIVDGSLDNPVSALSEARKIRDKKGVEIYVISVGTETPQPEMMMMCDYPTEKHFYRVDNYDNLEEMRETLVDVLCDEL